VIAATGSMDRHIAIRLRADRAMLAAASARASAAAAARAVRDARRELYGDTAAVATAAPTRDGHGGDETRPPFAAPRWARGGVADAAR
jgi:hypothetical protein